MKIVHLIMTGGYSEGWSYQDSVLIKEHSKKNDVYVITTQYERQKDKMIKVQEKEYTSPLGIRVFRLKHRFDFLPEKVKSVFRAYNEIYSILINIEPDIIFSHNLQFFGTYDIARYVKEHKNVKLFVDNHADYSNINPNWFSKNILHKIIWKHCAKVLVPYTEVFWGVLPARVDFLVNVYGVPVEKVKFLPIGMEREKAERAEYGEKIREIRTKYNIFEDEFLIVTGGKIDRFKKQTINLMRAVKDNCSKNVRLIVFGTVHEEIKQEFDSYVDNEKIIYVGWINSDETYDYIALADLVVYPGRHSVLWEQTVGQGKPMLCKWWEGTTHVDIGGNVLFLQSDSYEEIKNSLSYIIESKGVYHNMREAAQKEERKKFYYDVISDQSINLNC